MVSCRSLDFVDYRVAGESISRSASSQSDIAMISRLDGSETMAPTIDGRPSTAASAALAAWITRSRHRSTMQRQRMQRTFALAPVPLAAARGDPNGRTRLRFDRAPAASPKQCRSRSTCALRRTARRTGPRPCGKRRCAAGRGERALDPAAGSHVPDAATSTSARCPRWHVLSGARRRATGPGAHRASCGCRAARAAIARTAALHRGAARAPPPAAERRAASESASTAFSHARCPPRHGAVRASAARNGAQRARARDARGNGSSGSSRALPPE